MDQKSRLRQAKILRVFRKVHRILGAFLFIVFFVIGITGLILGWKKNSYGTVMPETSRGSSGQVESWMSLKQLQTITDKALYERTGLDIPIDRIDVRPDKGILKFIYTKDRWEVQVDGLSGMVLNIGQRHADFFENLHDGTVVDTWLGTSGYFKLFYTSLAGIALLIFSVTGFWLWYGPHYLRKQKALSVN